MKNFIMGFIAYFVMSIIFDVFEVNSIIIKGSIMLVVILIYAVIIEKRKGAKTR